MMLSNVIEAKKFSRVRKGYDPEEVDGFLNWLSAECDKLLAENTKLSDEVERLKHAAN